MPGWLWMIPLIAAAGGWLIALVLRKLLLRRLPLVIKQHAPAIAARFIHPDDVRSKISDPENVQNIMPLIEGHIDNFLRHKLGTAMPMIGMFIGDKTIGQLKAIFLQELQELFPVVMENYAGNLYTSEAITAIVSKKLSSVPDHQLRAGVRSNFPKQWHMIPLAGLLAGIIIGVMQLVFILFVI